MQRIIITLDLPQSERLTIEINLSRSNPVPNTLENDVRNAAIISLYKNGMLSMHEAADLVGCNYRNFEELFYKSCLVADPNLDLELETEKTMEPSV